MATDRRPHIDWCGGSYSEYETRKPFFGVRLTMFHWTHNERIYIGLRPNRKRIFGFKPWVPCVTAYPYPIGKSLQMRRMPRPARG